MPQATFDFIPGAVTMLVFGWNESHEDDPENPLTDNEKAAAMVCEVLNPWLGNTYRRYIAAINPVFHNPYVTSVT